MVTYEGVKAVSGVAIGRLVYYVRPDKHIIKTVVDDTDAELEAFRESKKKAIEQLEELYDSTVDILGEKNASIFVAQEMLLYDSQYTRFVEKAIVEGKNNAPYAISIAADEFSRRIASLEDAYMQSHTADVHDVTERMLRIVCGMDNDLPQLEEECIYIADEFNAGDLVQLDRGKVIGLASVYGSKVSHATILAGTMGIPTIVGIGQEILPLYDGKIAILDGLAGKIIIDPDDKTLERAKRRQTDYEEQLKMLSLLKGKNNTTKSGSYINVYANISSVDGCDAAIENDAGGVGLFRSEFIFMDSKTYPSEEEQFILYKESVERMRGRKIMIRTLDLGTDKQASYFRPDKEDNPALGYRAIRVSLSQPEIFKTQLRALLRASAYGNLDIILPMIISIDEVVKAKGFLEEIKSELEAENIPYRKEMRLGIMIETPAAVLTSDELAEEVDFFSIGTNDLTQYTLAIDRQNPKLEPYFNAEHPAILKMIEITVKNAHNAGIPVGICGELASDTELTQQFINMGIDSLSVAPNMVLPIRKRIRECE